MRVEVHNINVPLDAPEGELFRMAAKKAGIRWKDCNKFHIVKRSVDARRKRVQFSYSIGFDAPEGCKLSPEAKVITTEPEPPIVYGGTPLEHRPIVVGAGPAGLLCAYYLAKEGYAPVILERGGTVAERTEEIQRFLQTRTLNERCNIQFGEGGAGTFSDGKLTTRIGDPLCRTVLELLVQCGAPEEILYLAKPHIGTDLLQTVLVQMRTRISQLGGTFLFHHRLEDVELQKGRIVSITVNGSQMPAQAVCLAIGHSARDTYEMLHRQQVAMAPKAFAVGARIEHLQQFIDRAQYGDCAGHPKLGAADYRLVYNGDGRSCFSFCMCPGGSVVAAASEQNGVVVNGMSNHARSGPNANSALVVQVSPDDFGRHVLSGMEFQRNLERGAFCANLPYAAPAQNTADFIAGKKSTSLKGVQPTYPLGCIPADLRDYLPGTVCNTLAQAIRAFDRRIPGFAQASVLTGVETRTSAPLRILRSDTMESVNVTGLYPIGEGAGYAGGIMSAAVDGIKAARALMQTYGPPKL